MRSLLGVLFLVLGFSNISHAALGCASAKLQSDKYFRQFERYKANRASMNAEGKGEEFSRNLAAIYKNLQVASNYLTTCNCGDTEGWAAIVRGDADIDPKLPADCRP